MSQVKACCIGLQVAIWGRQIIGHMKFVIRHVTDKSWDFVSDVPTLSVISHYLCRLNSSTPRVVDWGSTCRWWIHSHFNSYAPERFGNNFKSVIPDDMLRIMFISTYCNIALMWMLQNTFDDNSTLVRIMTWYREAESHYFSRRWPTYVVKLRH